MHLPRPNPIRDARERRHPAVVPPVHSGPERVPILDPRPAVQGKFLFLGDDKLYLRGVTYGTFRPQEDGTEFPVPERVEADFAMMSAHGVNAVRTYTPPPLWLLDAAHRHALKVMVGLPVERSAAFLDHRSCVRGIEKMVRAAVSTIAGHPAVLCYAAGNEIPASVVRWHGHQKVERFLERILEVTKSEDPGGLVTYVNYPSTEYLDLPFLDLVAFNIYLESPTCFEAYLARLHNIAGDRPLIMAELGLDSLRHGEEHQAAAVDSQVRASFALGCAGAFVYSWTDEWYRGGGEVHDWAFGLTRRDRGPKPALATTRRAFAEVPFGDERRWPRISVIVCSYNGARTIGDCCAGLKRLDYPDHEVIVVDDGSTDSTGAIAQAYGFRVIRTPNQGLSAARNVGLEAASGEIVAYLDDDAYPDPHWLRYLALRFLGPDAEDLAGVGGPNIPPAADGLIADCVAMSPGGPSHVLLSDRIAEHIPGCNMAFRASRLRAIGGFDPRFRTAGDDVDVCWQLQQRGWTLGFSPAAVVWHHRRNSLRAYLRQQWGYGRAEAMLERKWPEKYNAAGYLTWAGRVYNSSYMLSRWRHGRIYHGVWGLAPFQVLYQPRPSLAESLPLMPEWFMVVAALAVLSALGVLWQPLAVNVPLLGAAVAISAVQAGRCAGRLPLRHRPGARLERLKLRALTACLHVLQPLTRLGGRLRYGLTLWRRPCTSTPLIARRWIADVWTSRSDSVEGWLATVEATIREAGFAPLRGNDYDAWDLAACAGISGSSRMSLAVENHGDGRQLLRFRCWPKVSALALAVATLFALLALGAAWDRQWIAAIFLGLIALLVGVRTLRECSASIAVFLRAVRRIEGKEP